MLYVRTKNLPVSISSSQSSRVCRAVMIVQPGLSKGAGGFGINTGRSTLPSQSYSFCTVAITGSVSTLLSMRPIRAELVLMLIAVAQRLNLCLMPADKQRPTSSWSADGVGALQEEDLGLSDVFPSPKLT